MTKQKKFLYDVFHTSRLHGLIDVDATTHAHEQGM